MQEGQNVTIDGLVFLNQTLYTINVTLSGQYLVNGIDYYVNVMGNDDFGVINATSKAVKVSNYQATCT